MLCMGCGRPGVVAELVTFERWLLASLSFFVYERSLTQSLEESINRREFRTPPNVPLKGRTPETEEAKQRARRVNRNRTIELVC
jgi:hypothetical protein